MYVLNLFYCLLNYIDIQKAIEWPRIVETLVY